MASGLFQRLNDPGYRLHGENPATATVADARRWVANYDKLIKFKHELLALCQRYAEHAEPEVARAIRETDVILLEIQLSRFEQKRDFWKIRATELSGNGRRGAPD
jgi:hypothetical protein